MELKFVSSKRKPLKGHKMCEPVQPVDMLKAIPFTVASLVEMTTRQGSYERAVGDAVYKSIRADIEKYVAIIEEELKRK